MALKSRSDPIDMKDKVFAIRDEPMPRGAWWWWFWLFFFDNPGNPARPRQLMILWSTKNEREIECNGRSIVSGASRDRGSLPGAVASWYFDGERMHHNLLLDQCEISVAERMLSTGSATPTSFALNGERSVIRIGDDFEFVAEAGDRHAFAMPTYHSHAYFRNMGYSMLRWNRLDLSGKVMGRPVRGSAYFQRVFVNAPSPGWYWGIFHFGKGGILTYFNPHLFGKSVKKDISFFDGKDVHRFDAMEVKRSGGDLPAFEVSGASGDERIRFIVNPYSHSSWTFRKRVLGFIPNRLVYNEYPAVISLFEFANRKTGKRIALEDLGMAVGNAEHTTGLLL